MSVRKALNKRVVVVFLWLCAVVVSPHASGQNLTFGVLGGGSLTDDFRRTVIPRPDGAITEISNASQWFMFGPTLELRLPKRLSLEVDAIHRRIRSQRMTTGSPEPVSTDGFAWQFSVLGKYRFTDNGITPFLEMGPSFLPRENVNQKGFTAGSGLEIRVWRLNVAPTLRYTRWSKSQDPGAVSDSLQFVVGVHEPSESMRPRAFGRPLSLGIVSGFGLTKLLREHDDPASRTFTGSNIPITGVMIELWIVDNLSAEMDVLYRPAYVKTENVSPDGSVQSIGRSTFLSWEFPVLAKYAVPVSTAAAVFELGPSFRSLGHANEENYSHHGLTAGLGVSTRIGGLGFTPTLRYTRWGEDKRRLGLPPPLQTKKNQLELVVGFAF